SGSFKGVTPTSWPSTSTFAHGRMRSTSSPRTANSGAGGERNAWAWHTRRGWAWRQRPAGILGRKLAPPEVQPEQKGPRLVPAEEQPGEKEEPRPVPAEGQPGPQLSPRRPQPAPSLPEHSAPHLPQEASWSEPWP